MTNHGPKILLVDIETSPLLVDAWGLYKQNIGLNQIVEDSSILSWSAKWRDSRRVMYEDVRGQKDIRKDKGILKSLWGLLDEADVVVAQNGKRFDEKVMNARFLINGMQEPSSFRSVDTLQIMKSRFRLTSNKLEYVAKTLGVGEKLTERPPKYNGHSLWRKCLEGDLKAFQVMEKYNKQDVLVLEKVWEKLQPWARGMNSLNWNVYRDPESGEFLCDCGSDSFKRNGYSYTNAGKWLRWRCSKCGSEYREKGIGKNLNPQGRGRV